MKYNDLPNAADIFNYDPDTGVIRWLCNNKTAGYRNDRGYWIIEYKGKRYKAHRIAYTIHHGCIPPDQIDHINGNKSDNRIKNIRSADDYINSRNCSLQLNNTSGHIGVFWDKSKKRWIAKIGSNNKKYCLGQFKNKQDAIDTRKIAEEVYDFHPNHGRNKPLDPTGRIM